ncbi:histidine decarboxylase, pyruvoyl type [Fructilactobacillus fructivorans]|uniref:Histidine decarboxylase proenzyme n=1 Tax=Fructilactobacillus fructivorans TaxID=1614 RepID=A0A0C1PR48_9LACO|nr:histidine decarboxylase, pyruvoyl type [Fructilactobacillus fructivorans]KID42356.1 Histidine decarboxylase proenzyme [Fructilactobacillus fructivorans]MCT0151027.1 histidine decarboxylase, pyruvoyl type [Fructilactobacillus fructivorans]MCT2867415.1 histidine decarboxylase, pyruvoyl type [Fructilactobacillus fructivorans]MCT2869066.1 histidine decarboxylase, pyruvoyl type [Fructilactobacillus fructivorans]MCT2873214.1 histidine decarboxylase, pyruvoyl type [Fructilactobacillus fructivorans
MAKIDKILNQEGIDRIAINPYQKYSRGYMEPGNLGGGYVTGLKVDAGTREKTDDSMLDGIVSYDRAECKNAYIGQINMMTASSFTGVQGHILGYDLLRNPAVDKAQPLFYETQWDGSKLPIYDGKPLQDSLVEFFGTADNRRHYPAPGSFIVCANKGVTAERPLEDRPLNPGEAYGVWSAIAISIAKDPVHNSSMFIEDAGTWNTPNEDDLNEFLYHRREAIARSIAQCGQDASTSFASSWIGFAHVMMKPGEIGNAITVGPYFSMPVDAVPGGSILTPDVDMNIMEDLSLPEWLEKMGYQSIVENQDIQY